MTAKKRADAVVDASEQAMRDQEALRANKELAGYFKGRRTEREARAALKIIKAFVRDRERRGTKSPPPLPGRAPTATPKTAPKAKPAGNRTSGRRQPPQPPPETRAASTLS